MERRKFLKASAAVAAGALMSPYLSKGKDIIDLKPIRSIQGFEDDKILIIIELIGGNDGLNTIIPVNNPNYYTLRPNINYPKNLAKQFGTSDLFLNPALVDNISPKNGMMKLLEEDRLAIIEGIGYDNQDLSHCRSSEFWHSGLVSSDPKQKILDGWLGRYFSSLLPTFPVEMPAEPLAISVSGDVPLLFKSTFADMGIAVQDADKFYQLGQGFANPLPTMPGTDNFLNEINFLNIQAKQSKLYSAAVKKAYDKGKNKIKANYSSGFSQKFKFISQLIAGGLSTKVYYVRLGNFDTHVNQMSPSHSGQHPNLLNQLATAICEFTDDAVQLGYDKKVIGMTISEFGRRAYENSNSGTDHGASSVQFVFGTNVIAGYHGNPPNLSSGLDSNGNVGIQFDYRKTYTDIMETWFGATADESKQVFGNEFLPIGVIKPKPIGVYENISQFNGKNLSIGPNPSEGACNLKFELKTACQVRISIHSVIGAKVLEITNTFMNAGYYQIPFIIDSAGTYICSVEADGQRFTEGFVICK
ncbi:MAG: DUF1501 domain-containing protein [Candidatus Kapabacteria bacterium]|nr:DUF1501 domain-containing protein [Candidatus Kapabacteria bacterium]